jgi:hypothetical protein
MRSRLPQAMHAVLERVVSQIADELAGLDAEMTHLHPRGLNYRWNAQQIIEHLVLEFRQSTQMFEKRLSKGHQLRDVSRTRVQWLLQLVMLSFGRYPVGVPAMEDTVPKGGEFAVLSGRQLIELLRCEIELMDGAMDRCRAKFGMEKVGRHPLLGPLRVDQWRRFHVVHGLHHLGQLRRVIAELPLEPVPVRKSGTQLVKELQIPVQRPLA